MRRINALFTLLLLWMAAAVPATAEVPAAQPRKTHLGEGCDLEFGGMGAGEGLFDQLVDITIDSRDRIYVLDGSRYDRVDAKAMIGNRLVQIFNPDGTFVSQFSIRDDGLKDKDVATRIAVDSRGGVWLTYFQAGLVKHFTADGTFEKNYKIPFASAIACQKGDNVERIVVIPRQNKGKGALLSDEVPAIDVASGEMSSLKLDSPIGGGIAATGDRRGNLWVLADKNQIYKIDQQGKRLATLGGGTQLMVDDGSELISDVAVDPSGYVYGLTYGNPGKFTRFDPDLKRLTQRSGRFNAVDPWANLVQIAFAIDTKGRIWIASPRPARTNPNPTHPRPVIARLAPDYFKPATGVTESSTLRLGLFPAVETKLPYNIAGDLKPIDVDLVMRAAVRQVNAFSVRYRVLDSYKTPVTEGSFDLDAESGADVRHTITFTPPSYGLYSTQFYVSQRGGEQLVSQEAFIGVTPRYPNVPWMEPDESKGGWTDAPRHAFVGLKIMRVHPTEKTLDKVEQQIDAALAKKLTVLVQLSGPAECTADFATRVASRYRGKVKYYEVFNEPTLSMGADKYLKYLEVTSPAIKAADPDAKVMGPTGCGIPLDFYRKFYELGGGKFIDILSLHDYEGNEGIDQFHWPWKFGELRKLMAEFGQGDREIWQTERAVSGILIFTYSGAVQAIRVSYHYDLLESLGIPNEHNSYYYLNEGGYLSVPSWLWSRSGPMPAAMVMRTRTAMIEGRRYVGKLDFGPTGEKIFLGLKYVGDDGTTLTLRNHGTLDQPLTLNVTGGNSIEVVDAYGNTHTEAVINGQVRLPIGAYPTYVRLAKGQDANPERLDFGKNLAPQADYSYSTSYKGDLAVLTNGWFESSHTEDPGRNQQFVGDLPDGKPQTLHIRFAKPRTVDKMIVYSMRADNNYCALLDYDIQALDGGKFVTIQEVRTPVPPSDTVVSYNSVGDQYYLDTNFFVNEFKPVTTDFLRLVVHRCTYGLYVDQAARDIRKKDVKSKLMLREIEIYGPADAVEMHTAGLVQKTEGFEREPLNFTVKNTSAQPFAGRVKITPPAGFTTSTSELPVTAAAGATSAAMPFDLIAGWSVATGTVPIDLELQDAAGKTVTYDRITLAIKPPVQLTAKPIAGKTEERKLAVEVKNLSGQPIQGSVKLTLTPLANGQKAIEQEQSLEAPIKPKGASTVVFNIPGIDLSAGPWTATYATTVNKLTVSAEQVLSQTRAWSIIGPFPDVGNRGLETATDVEQATDVSKSYTDSDGQTVSWKTVQCDAAGFVNLLSAFKPNENVVAYAATWVKNPSDRSCQVVAGADDAERVWVNGQQVINRAEASSGAGQDRANVQLKVGWNPVLVKVSQASGGWGFWFELCDAKGLPLGDLIFSDKPQ